MKRKLLNSMRMLLVAAGLCLGANAWAEEGDEIYVNDFSSKDQTDFATWTASGGSVPSGYSYTQIGRNGAFSIATGALVHTAPTAKSSNNVNNADFGVFKDAITLATASTNYVLSFDITLAIIDHIACTSIFEISGEDKKTILCLYANHTRSNSSTGATSYGYIVGGNNAFAVADAGFTKKNNAEGYMGDGTQNSIAANVNGMTGSKTYHVILDAQTVGMAKLTVKEGETKVVDELDVSISADKGIKYIYFNDYNRNGVLASQITIDNFSIVEGAPTVAATAYYTVKYVANIGGDETEIKTAAVRTGLVDATVSLTDADKNTIWYNDVKYVYSSDNASTSTIADDNSTVVKVVFTAAPSYTYSVTDNLGNDIASGSAYEGENIYFYVPYYVFKGGKFYQSPSLSSGSLSYGKGTISAIAANTDITVTYVEEGGSNVVFFAEAENLTGVTVQEDGYTHDRMSNGKTGYYSSQTAFTTLPAGVYTLTASTRTGTTTFYAGSVGEGVEIGKVVSSGTVETTTSDEFILAQTTDIYTSIGSSTAYFDYVIIRKTGDLPSTEKIVVSDAGMATYVSNYNLDFTSATAKAYKVEVTAKGVATMTEVKKVPAKTPVLLVCAGGNGEGENIPVISDALSAVSGNDLVAGTGATVATTADGYTNMILNKVGENVGFFLANDNMVAANRAYLHFSSSLAPGSDAPMMMVFGDDNMTTGVSEKVTVNSEKFAAAPVYNLNGQRVSQPTKGLYIVGGKKVVVK